MVGAVDADSLRGIEWFGSGPANETFFVFDNFGLDDFVDSSASIVGLISSVLTTVAVSSVSSG